GCQPSLATHVRRQIQARTPEGFRLFVATIYGEMAGVHRSPELAWKAAGSVIMNRVHTGIWHRYKTTDEIIAHTGFDAYANPDKINWNHVNLHSSFMKHHQQFLKAWATLHQQKMNSHLAMNPDERKLLDHMRLTLEDIYYKNKTITTANYYYSPRGMHGKTPSFLIGIDKPEQYQVKIAGLNEKDITLYDIPSKIERKAGRER
ncbi:MAG: hypothetical protein JSR33_11170, partial [Proteobacteria bacterium]|nr:hypothetical protein [Pseudomonadota bacterium]